MSALRRSGSAARNPTGFKKMLGFTSFYPTDNFPKGYLCRAKETKGVKYMEIIDRLRQCARPVIFETGNNDAPYSTAGTAFLVGFRQSLFVLTAAHVVRNCPIDKLLVFPSDKSAKPLRLNTWWPVEGNPDDPDASDMLIIKADLESIPVSERNEGCLIHLTHPQAVEWFEARDVSQFFLCGYPLVRNGVDYFRSEINTQQFFLAGTYKGKSPPEYCHVLNINNPLNLDDFNGLSGSPVFCQKFENGVATAPIRFCGMVLLGTAESGLVHFLDAQRLVSVLSVANDVK